MHMVLALFSEVLRSQLINSGTISKHWERNYICEAQSIPGVIWKKENIKGKSM